MTLCLIQYGEINDIMHGSSANWFGRAHLWKCFFCEFDNANKPSGSLNGSGEVLYQIASDAYHTHRARIFNDWDVFSAVDSRDLIRLRKGYTIEITEKLYSNEVVKVKLLDGRNKGELYYAIADDLSKKYLLEDQEKENEDI